MAIDTSGLRAVFTLLVVGIAGLVPAQAGETADQRIVADLDTKYQKAVQDNDAKTMAAILSDDFVLVEGDGKRSTKADLVNDAASGKTHYQRQEDTDRTVIIHGSTAIVTAKLWAKGIEDGEPADYQMWFTDVYMRTGKGWRYVYAQSSLPLPH